MKDEVLRILKMMQIPCLPNSLNLTKNHSHANYSIYLLVFPPHPQLGELGIREFLGLDNQYIEGNRVIWLNSYIWKLLLIWPEVENALSVQYDPDAENP